MKMYNNPSTSFIELHVYLMYLSAVQYGCYITGTYIEVETADQ